MLIGLGLCLLGVFLVGPGLSLQTLFIPLIIAPVFFIALGFSWFFSALGVFIRTPVRLDPFWVWRHLIPAECFTLRKKPRWRHPPFGNSSNGILSANYRFPPFGYPMGRRPKLERNPIRMDFGLIVLFSGAWFFNRLRPAFADVL